jgi:2-C-methyl-D-erythritol 4-phosphate cytidylyltransferase
LSFALLMPAAGGGVRLGTDRPKALVEIAGLPMFIQAARPFLRHPQCAEAVIAVPAGWESRFRSAAKSEWGEGRVKVVTGGAVRQESVARALEALTSDAEFVLMHDAARPLIEDGVIERVLVALIDTVAVVPALPVVDTLKRVDERRMVLETVDRRDLVAVQTPQGILREAAKEAYRRALATGFVGTDDVSLIEHFGLGAVAVVNGDPGNFKITTAEDLALGEKLMELQADRAAATRKDR